MKLYIAYFVISYLLGSIPSGIIMSRIFGFEDPRKVGSGNIGATNVLRAGGKTPALLTLIMDVAKGYVPTFIFSKITGSLMVGFICGFFAFLGHLFPLYLGFRGGKGVATALGVFLYISPATVLIAFFVFLAVFLSRGVVSLSSIISSIILPFIILIVERSGKLFANSILFSVLIILKHIPNIKRLKEGKEKRIFKGILG